MAVRSAAQAPEHETSHSGRLLLRMPKTLHAELAARADVDGISLNQYIVGALTRAVSGVDVATPPSATVEPERRMPRSVRMALTANAVVVALAAVTAIVLLVAGVR